MKKPHRFSPRSRWPISAHVFQSSINRRKFIANLRFSDGRTESLEISGEGEAIGVAAVWQEAGARVHLAWLDSFADDAEGPEAS